MDIFSRMSNSMSTSATVQKESTFGFGGVFKRFFEPDKGGRVRLRDVVREIPDSFIKTGRGLATFGKDVLQGIARSGGSVGISVANKVFQPLGFSTVDSLKVGEGSDVEIAFKRILFGQDVESLGKRISLAPGRATELAEQFGFDQKLVTKKTAPLFVFGLTALDFTGAGGSRKGIFTAIAKTGKVDDIAKLLRKSIGNMPEQLVDDVAQKLVKVTDPKKVGQVIESALDNSVNLAKQGRRVKFADDYVRTINERGFITTVKQSPKTSSEVARKIASNYNPLNNAKTLRAARELIRNNVDEAVRFARDTKAPATANSNAVSQLLVQRAQQAGRWSEAIELVEITAERATKQGQAIQALAMYNRLSPEGILRFAKSTFDKANKINDAKKFGRAKNVKLTEEIADSLSKQARKIGKMKDGEAKAIETALMIADIQKQIPAGLGRKLATFQILAQLLNPKTLIRNIGGNTGFSALENVTDVFAVAIDSPLSIITGRRSKVLPSLITQMKGFKAGLRQGVRDALLGVDTMGLPTRFDLPKTPVFKGVVGRNAEKLLNVVLRGPDRAAYKAAYDGSLYNQMKASAKGRKGIFVGEPTERMKEIAHYDGLYRTFQDDNVISRAFVFLKRDVLNLGKDFGMGDICAEVS